MLTEARTWGGTSMADRTAARRRQLLEAGIDLLGSEGGAAVSVRAVCRQTRLTERYFYESFADREALVLAVYEQVSDEARRALVAAVRSAAPGPLAVAEAAVTAFVELILDDPRKGRVLLLAPQTDPTLFARGVELLPSFAGLVREQLAPEIDDLERDMTAIGLVGALGQLFVAYLDGTLVVSRERLVDHCVQMLVRAHRPALGRPLR